MRFIFFLHFDGCFTENNAISKSVIIKKKKPAKMCLIEDISCNVPGKQIPGFPGFVQVCLRG